MKALSEMCKKPKSHSIIIGIISIIVGLMYVIGVYGATEAEVGYWGLLSVLLGILLIVISFLIENKLTRIILVFLSVFSLLIQILPISLWFAFHGSGISDGTPPSSFTAHWGFSIPHIIIFILCIINILKIKNMSKLRV